MHQRWWEGVDLAQPGVPGEAMVEYVERCPFCGRDFDRRDLGQVLEHYYHQLSAGGPRANDLTLEEDKPQKLRKVIPFRSQQAKGKP